MQELKDKILKKTAKVCVFGMGYVGIPLSILIAKAGFETHGAEVDKRKIDFLNKGINPMPDLKEVDTTELKNLIETKRLFVAEPEEASKDTDIKLIAVQTPIFPDRKPDLSFVRSVLKVLKNTLKKGDLIINESTISPGMTRKEIIKYLENETRLKAGEDFFVVASPERVDPGNIVWTIDKIPKVVGGINNVSVELGKLFYSNFIREVITVSSLEAAEATKMLENSFRALNIGFINEFAKYCDTIGINVLEVIEAAATKPFAFEKHFPSIGVGGTCIPKDPYYLISGGEEVGIQFSTLWNAMLANESMPYYTASILQKVAKENNVNLQNAKVVLFGISYKGNVRDTRDSPALVSHNILKREGVNVSVYDPLFSEEELKNMGLIPCNPHIDNCDAIIIGCNHNQFKSFDYGKIKNLKFIIDGKNMLSEMHVPVYGIGKRFNKNHFKTFSSK